MELILGIVWMVRKMLETEELKYWNWVHFSFLLGSLKFEFLLHYLIAKFGKTDKKRKEKKKKKREFR